MIIARGKIVADCEPQALEQRSKFHGALTLAFAERANAAEFVGALAGLEHVALVEQVVGKNQLTVFPRHKEQSILLDVSHLVRERQMPVASIVQEKGRLDEVFREVTEEVSL
jgi:ABC-2 type transport system ATP-binding protein